MNPLVLLDFEVGQGQGGCGRIEILSRQVILRDGTTFTRYRHGRLFHRWSVYIDTSGTLHRLL